MKKLLLLITLVFIGYTSTFASHLMGGEITYTYVGGNDYEVTLMVYRDCSGINLSTTSANVTFESASCGQNFMTPLPYIQTVDVSQVCPGQTTTCNGGTVPGTEQFIYRGIITLTPCSDWIIHWNAGTRNPATTNLVNASSTSLFIQNTLNNVIGVNNNSPQFFNLPTPYLCANQLAIYSHAAADPDGDSLYYAFNNPLTTPGPPGTPIPFTAGYSLLQPMITSSGINLNQQTGEMCFTPSQAQISVISVLISEYRNGVLIGTQIREMQVIVSGTCSNQNPSAGGTVSCGGSNGMIITISGSSVDSIDQNSIAMCPDDNVCLEITFTDPNPTDNITVLDNIGVAIPGATWTVANDNTPNPVGTFCWIPTALDSGLNVFTIILEDDACPISGTSTFTYDITVYDQPYAGPDQTTCGTQGVQLDASGGATYTWFYVASNTQVPVGAEFSCNPCYNPIATPLVTSDYYVLSSLTAACENTDTMTVNIVPDYTLTTTQTDTAVCLGQTVDFNATINPAGAYNYTWSPAGIFNNPNIANPTATFNVPGNITIYLSVDNGGGCLKADTLNVNVASAIAPNINILTPDSFMDCGDSVLIDLDLGGGIPATCGASASNSCSGAATQITMGTSSGANGTTSWPAPYGNYYRNAKHQFLYTAAELNAMGFIGGKITEIAWEITTINGTATYNDYQIKMGCTSTINLTAWESGLTPVFGSPIATHNINVAVGWNTHTLDVAYEWDGVSNLVVEICYDNLGSSYTNNSITPWTTTAFTSSIWYRSDSQNACAATTSTGTGNDRPITRFSQCPTIPDPASFTYSWSPNTGITTSNLQNPMLHPSVPTTYTVTVTDGSGNCFDTDSINISVLCGACYQPTITTQNPTCKDGLNGKITIDPTFILGSDIQSFTWTDSLTNTVLQTTLNLSAGMQDSLINIGAGAYTITMVDSSGCSKDTTIWLTEPDSVIISAITPDSIICIGGSKQINASATGGNGTPYNYTWSDLSTSTPIPGNGPHTVNPIVSPTCYSVFATDPLGCISSTSQVCISLYPNILASTTNATINICPNTSTPIDISAIGGSGAGYNYEWFENGVSIGTGTTINVTPATATTIYTGVVNDNCTTPADSITVTVNWVAIPVPSFTRNKPDSCYPITIEFTNTSTLSGLIDVSTILWSTSTGSTGGGNTFTSTFNAPLCEDVSLSYTTNDGCLIDTTYQDFICPHDYPVASFNSTPSITNVVNSEVEFTNNSTGVDPLSYLWDFNSGLFPDTSIATNPIFMFPDDSSGTYPITLMVTDSNGCVSYAQGTVIVNGIYLFYPPNSFSPNGDGINEVFRVYGEGIELSSFSMKIFDRWGELIFTSNNIEDGWDGSYKGKQLGVDTYVWKIVAKEKYGTIVHDNIGRVTLIR